MSDTQAVLLLSFNRPGYFRSTLRSLARQTERNWQICLFQDGPRPSHRKDLRRIEKCVQLFRYWFPAGEVFRSDENIGIARNMLTAQRYAFRDLGCDAAFFFEDDMVLHRRYLEQLFLLRQTFDPIKDVIPYFSAYGDIFTRRVPSTELSEHLSVLDHLWGFGLFREHWEMEQELMAPYFDYIQSVPYRERDHEWIQQLYRKMKIPLDITSQDGARMAALFLLNRAAVRTRQPLARYIGKKGTHYTPKIYRQWGFGKKRCSIFARALQPRMDSELIDQLPSLYRQGVIDLHPPVNNELATDSQEELEHYETHYRRCPQAFIPTPGSLSPGFSISLWPSRSAGLERRASGAITACSGTAASGGSDVGVWKGQSTMTLARALRKQGIDGAVVSIDTWLGSPEHWNPEREQFGLSELRLKNGYPQLFNVFRRNVIRSGLQGYVVPLPQTSLNAAEICVVVECRLS